MAEAATLSHVVSLLLSRLEETASPQVAWLEALSGLWTMQADRKMWPVALPGVLVRQVRPAALQEVLMQQVLWLLTCCLLANLCESPSWHVRLSQP